MLDSIQEHLENIYGIRCEYRARDFLVTDAEAARQLGGSARAREELLVSEGAEGLELALYLDPALLSRVTAAGGPLDAELGDFCEVAEGVSHFLYVAHTAGLNRSVSLLELEAQAEVDKFAICTLLGWQHVGRWAGTLVKRLFDQVQLRGHLDAAEQWRYCEANRLGKRYASRLMPLVSGGRLESFLSELRHAYRLGAEAKLAYFAR